MNRLTPSCQNEREANHPQGRLPSPRDGAVYASRRGRWYGVVRVRSIFAVLFGTVMLPTFLLSLVGILTLVFWRATFDVAFGILILSFSAASIFGGVVATLLVRLSAQRAGAQSDFVSNVSHELRTPLTSIRMFADTLLSGAVKDEDERIECLRHIATETARLSQLVERLLDVRRMEQGKRLFAEVPVDIEDVVHAAAQSQVRWLKERNISLNVNVDPGLPKITGDREALVTAVANLLENAIWHGGADKTIRLRAQKERAELLVVVNDEGPGIPRRALRRIFESFYQVEGDRRSKGGLGLGLTFVRQIAEAHGGNVVAASQEGCGSEFTLRLPLPPPSGCQGNGDE